MPDPGHGFPDEAPGAAVFERLMWYELEGHRPSRVKPPHRAHVGGGEGRGLASLVLQQRVEKVGAAPHADLSESCQVLHRIGGGTS